MIFYTEKYCPKNILEQNQFYKLNLGLPNFKQKQQNKKLNLFSCNIATNFNYLLNNYINSFMTRPYIDASSWNFDIIFFEV